MKFKFFNIALGLALSTVAFNASAQKKYTQGVLTYTTEMRGQQAEVKQYFTADSTAAIISFGPAVVKILSDAKHDYLAVVLDVPVASIKKAGIATPSEIEAAMAMVPSFTYTTTAETKQISGFNCKKVVAKDTKSGKTYDIWITNDIEVPMATASQPYYAGIGGFPVQYTSFSQGQEVSITIASISDQKAPAGTFAIAKDFEKVGMADLGGGE